MEIRKKSTKPGKKFLFLAKSLNVTEKKFQLEIKMTKSLSYELLLLLLHLSKVIQFFKFSKPLFKFLLDNIFD